MSNYKEKSKREFVIYVSGAYFGDDDGRSVNKNILFARDYAIQLWEKGYTVICPHLNTQYFERDCKCVYDDFLEGDLELIKRCDGIFMLPNYKTSKGALKEKEIAEVSNLPVFYEIDGVDSYYENQISQT